MAQHLHLSLDPAEQAGLPEASDALQHVDRRAQVTTLGEQERLQPGSRRVVGGQGVHGPAGQVVPAQGQGHLGQRPLAAATGGPGLDRGLQHDGCALPVTGSRQRGRCEIRTRLTHPRTTGQVADRRRRRPEEHRAGLRGRACGVAQQH